MYGNRNLNEQSLYYITTNHNYAENSKFCSLQKTVVLLSIGHLPKYDYHHYYHSIAPITSTEQFQEVLHYRSVSIVFYQMFTGKQQQAEVAVLKIIQYQKFMKL